MPKDKEQNAGSYPSVRSTLMHNPYGTAEYKRLEAARKKAEAAAKVAAAKAAKKAEMKVGKKKKVKLETVVEAPAAEEGLPKARNE